MKYVGVAKKINYLPPNHTTCALSRKKTFCGDTLLYTASQFFRTCDLINECTCDCMETKRDATPQELK